MIAYLNFESLTRTLALPTHRFTTPTCIDEAVQPPHEDGAAGVQARGGAADGVAVRESPGNHLHLLVVDTPARDLGTGKGREKKAASSSPHRIDACSRSGQHMQGSYVVKTMHNN